MPKCQFPYADGSTCNENAVCTGVDKSGGSEVQVIRGDKGDAKTIRAFFKTPIFSRYCLHHQSLMKGSRAPQDTKLYSKETILKLITRRDIFRIGELERRRKRINQLE
jgi:hypothetical protein